MHLAGSNIWLIWSTSVGIQEWPLGRLLMFLRVIKGLPEIPYQSVSFLTDQCALQLYIAFTFHPEGCQCE